MKSFEEIKEYVAKEFKEHIEMMSAAYIKATKIPVAEAELVYQQEGNEWHVFFRRRAPEKAERSAGDNNKHLAIAQIADEMEKYLEVNEHVVLLPPNIVRKWARQLRVL